MSQHPTTTSLDAALQKGFILQITVHVSPTDVERFMSLFQPVHDLVVAEKECVFFMVGRHVSSPLNTAGDHGGSSVAISWTEGWSESVDWFMDVQFKKEYYGPYFKATEPLFVKPREIQVLAAQSGMSKFKAW